MEFRILGPLEVSAGDGALKVGGPKQRAVLAHLILRANHPVPVDLLTDGLWGEEPPQTAKNTLQTYVYRLRQVLGEDRIGSDAGGYVLRAEPTEIDAARFEALVRAAKAELGTDPSRAAAALSDALALWRGAPLSDLSDEPSLRGEIARLEELHLSATEHRIAAEIAMGDHSTVVSELEALTARYPLRERMWANLMLALYRLGRQAESLAAYQRAREVLADELGAEPSAELQRLHEQILRHNPSLGKKDAPKHTIKPSRVDLQSGTEFAGYRIVSTLGRGGMAVVYLAEHDFLQRKVALKVLAPQLAEDERFRERFVRESRLAASLDHPNVVPIYEAGASGGDLFIAMRYVEGTDLRTLLAETGALDPTRAVSITRQVASALEAAHEQGLVHRDVKPGNVLVARTRGSEAEEHVYLSDFGLTKRSTSESGVTGTGQFVGTLDYAAPEQFQGGTPDARTDVYSLGCVLFECLSGHPPFQAGNDAGLMYAHLQEDPPALTSELPDLPQGIDVVLAKAMAKDPAARFQNAGDLAEAASRALGVGEPIPLPTGSARRSRVGGRWLSAGLGAALTLVIVLASVVLALGNDGSTSNTHPQGSPAASAADEPGIIPTRAVAAIDPKTGTLLDAQGGFYLETAEGAVSPDIAYADGKLWVIDAISVSGVDPVKDRIRPGAPLATQDPRFQRVVIADSGYVLMTDGFRGASEEGQSVFGGIGKIDPTGTGSDRKAFQCCGAATDLEAGAGAIWETFQGGILLQIAARNLHADTATNVGGTLDAVGVDNVSVWIGEGDRALVWRVDPRSLDRTEPFEVNGAVDAIAALRGVAWVLDRTAGTVTPVGTTFGPGQPIRVGEKATDIAAGLGAIWVADRGGSLWRVDPQTRKTSTIDVGYPVEAVTFDPERGALWVLLVECPLSGAPESETPLDYPACE